MGGGRKRLRRDPGDRNDFYYSHHNQHGPSEGHLPPTSANVDLVRRLKLTSVAGDISDVSALQAANGRWYADVAGPGLRRLRPSRQPGHRVAQPIACGAGDGDAYVAAIDNEQLEDVDLFEITDPRNPGAASRDRLPSLIHSPWWALPSGEQLLGSRPGGGQEPRPDHPEQRPRRRPVHLPVHGRDARGKNGQSRGGSAKGPPSSCAPTRAQCSASTACRRIRAASSPVVNCPADLRRRLRVSGAR
jgi:hypothetical protein